MLAHDYPAYNYPGFALKLMNVALLVIHKYVALHHRLHSVRELKRSLLLLIEILNMHEK